MAEAAAQMNAKIEKTAKALRAHIRKRAGLAPDWKKASEGMKAFYREHARRIEGDDA